MIFTATWHVSTVAFAAKLPNMNSTSGEPDQPARETDPSMLPVRRERPPLESAFVRVVATCGVVGIGVAVGAILGSQNVQGWIIGLVVALVSVVISAILWSSRGV